jgi:2,3,4,5-tetrahydropyridine-2-carboxylate N-succinyltransferase
VINNLKNKIEAFWDGGERVEACELDVVCCVQEVFSLLNDGKIRVAEKIDGVWITRSWIKKAILLAFKFMKASKREFDSFDKLGLLEFDYSNPRYRKVCPAVIRNGAYIGNNAVVMPSYINTGAYIGDNAMIDIGAVIGSCAQIGSGCHISAQSCIGGVLEPAVDSPVIVEDNCFIGVHSSVLEGVIVEENAIIASGLDITASTKIIDRETGKVFLGKVPSGAVVVPGSYPSNGLNVTCGIIVKMVDSKIVSKTRINEILREHTEI